MFGHIGQTDYYTTRHYFQFILQAHSGDSIPNLPGMVWWLGGVAGFSASRSNKIEGTVIPLLTNEFSVLRSEQTFIVMQRN